MRAIPCGFENARTASYTIKHMHAMRALYVAYQASVVSSASVTLALSQIMSRALVT